MSADESASSVSPMSPERWQEVLSVFHKALDRPTDDRHAFLDRACGADPVLRRDVERLLDADAQASILDTRGPGLHLAIERDSLAEPEIGPYRVDAEVGRGGMGVVYRATRTDVGSIVALKMLRERFPSTERVERFLREQRVLGRLQHPGIARFLDAGLAGDGTPFFVMEFVDGAPITDACRDLELSTRLTRFLDACDAVQYAHRQLVVHRDIKPSNVLVTPDGEVKLLDFGIAKLLEDDAQLTQTRERLLTPAYAAPEQVRAEDVSTATDVYALGALLYEVLTGTRPIDVDGLAFPEAAERILRDEPVPPSRRAASTKSLPSPTRLHGDLDTICLTALRKEPNRRYASVEALKDDVERFLSNRPITARPDSLSYRAAKFVRRNRAWAVAGLAAALVLGAVLAFYTVRLTEERDRATEQAAIAESVVAFLVATLDEGSPNAAPGDTLTVYDIVDHAEERAGAFQDQPLVFASVLDAVGRVRTMHGDLDRADSLYRVSLTSRRAELGSGHPDLAVSLNRLADVRIQQGQYAKADSLLQAAQSVLPPDAFVLRRATTLRLQAKSHMLQSRLPEADSLFRASLDLQQRHRTPTHREVVNTYADLGRTQLMNGDYDAAEANFQRALDGFREQHPEGHTVTSALLTNLATIQRVRGRYAQADSLYRVALDMMRRLVGQNHPSTASILNNMGANAYRQGDFDASAGFFRETLAARTALLGDTHPDVAAAHNNLAAVLMRSGRFEAAEPHLRRTTEILKTTLGPNHANTITALDNLAGLHEERGDLETAESLRRDVLERYRTTLGPEHPRMGMALTNLGALLEKKGRYAEAEQHLHQALTLRRTILEDGHPAVASTLSTLGRVYASQARWPEAEAAYREALTIREARTPEHEATASARLHLGDALRAQGRFEEAEPYIVDGITLAQSVAPDIHEESRAVFERFYDAWGRPDRASAVRDSLGLAGPGPDSPESDGPESESNASIAAGPTDPDA